MFSNDKAAFPVYTVTSNGAAANNRTAGTYEVTGTSTNASGSGAEFSVVVASDGTPTVTITSCGTGYMDGNTITITDAKLGGGGAASVVLTVANGVGTFNEPINILTNNNTGLANGPKGGYISIKKTFVIAKGRVGVS